MAKVGARGGGGIGDQRVVAIWAPPPSPALVSRQYMEMSRIRIEGLLAAFPKLVGTGNTKQHTYVETENVRYVYQPMEVRARRPRGGATAPTASW